MRYAGTGKTLLARALANECSRIAGDQSGNANGTARPIAFFMRKGADCMSKWVGESERQLRLLFDQAYRMRPSIIFFDEIDGLAPVRSSRQVTYRQPKQTAPSFAFANIVDSNPQPLALDRSVPNSFFTIVSQQL